MSYLGSLSSSQKKNLDLIIDTAKKNGITNPISIAGLLAIVSKESAFNPQGENMNYSASRIREVFPSVSDQAESLAHNPEKLANAVYGGKYGNAQNEGYKYRGRGFNGLTFKSNYQKYGNKINTDLVSNPDKVNEPIIASKILIDYNKDRFLDLAKIGKLQFYGNAKDINDFKDTKNSVLAFYHVTAGNGKSVEYVKGLAKNDTLGGMTKALSRVDELLNYVNGNTNVDSNENNSAKFSIFGLIIGIVIGGGAFFLINKKK